jgi:hypothetical protein
MKNVAKCDTWCELQNPVNHRVFERKLRPRPSGRGHACLGVTHRVAPFPRTLTGAASGRGADTGPPCLRARPAQILALRGRRHAPRWSIVKRRRIPERLRAEPHEDREDPSERPTGRIPLCDPRSGGTTR